MNDTTYQLMSKTEHWKTQQILKNKVTRLLCKLHGVQTVTELQGGTVTLACLCRRKLFSSDAIASYESERADRGGHRTVSGSNNRVQMTESEA